METNESTCESPAAGSFAELGIKSELVEILSGTHLEHPTELQRQLVPLVLEGKSCLVQARSGAGKTNAYVIPILEKIEPGAGVQALIFQPTRATALRVRRSFSRFLDRLPGTVAVLAGGGRQPVRDPIEEPPDVLIVSPRCARDIVVEKPDEWWSKLRTIVIDEADTLLDAGDRETIEQVLSAIGADRQKILIAAGLSDELRELAHEHFRDPVTIESAPEKPAVERIDQALMNIGDRERFEVLVGFCKQSQPRLTIVFTRDDEDAGELVERLARVRVSARSVGQARPRRRPEGRDRDDRGARSEIVVAGDPAPRRISTIPASHVLHYEMPADEQTYARRLEQCDRLHRNGVSIALIDSEQHELLERIEALAGKPLRVIEPPERHERQPSSQSRGRSEERGASRPAPERRVCEQTKPPPAQTPASRPPAARPAAVEKTSDQPVAMPKTLGSRFRPRRKPKRMWSS